MKKIKGLKKYLLPQKIVILTMQCNLQLLGNFFYKTKKTFVCK